MQKRNFLSTLIGIAAALLVSATPAYAQLAVGRDYVPINPPQPTENAAKIEIVEFFSYGCPHCSDFHPLISKWAAKLPADVTFKRVPVSFGRSQWANIGKLYYAAEAIGELGRLDNAAFHAIHQKNIKLYDDATIIEWVGQQGVDSKKFSEAYNSFGVQSKMKRADQMAGGYKVQGVPAIAVDGRYMVLGKEVKSYDELLTIADQVIAKVRSEKKK
jgi:thiol:disulfide interchange protein DsbA